MRVTDKVGLVGWDNATFTIDSVKPTVSIAPANGALFNVSGVTVTWTVEAMPSRASTATRSGSAGDWMTAVKQQDPDP